MEPQHDLKTILTYDGGTPCLRLPKPLYHTLHEMRGHTKERPLWQTLYAGISPDPKAEHWHMVRRVPMLDPLVDNPSQRQPGIGYYLTPLGEAFANLCIDRIVDRRRLTPRWPLAEVLAALPEPIRRWITTSPIAKNEGGLFFVEMGVIRIRSTGEWIPSRELQDAMQNSHDGPADVTLVQSGLFTTEMMQFLRQALSGGVSWKDNKIDGRIIKPFADGYMRLVTFSEQPVKGWTVPPTARRVASLIATGERRSVPLFLALPDASKEWLTTHMATAADDPFAYLMHKFGWLRKRGGDWVLSDFGERVLPEMRAAYYAQIGGQVSPDAGADDLGGGSDITLDDLPADLPAVDPLDALSVDMPDEAGDSLAQLDVRPSADEWDIL